MTLRLNHPVMIASGCGGTGRELAPYLDLDGFAFVTRTLSRDPRVGTTASRMAEAPSGLLNTLGVHNPGLAHFLDEELPWLVGAGAQVFVSVAGATLGEYAELARLIGRAPGVAGIEVNVSLPDPGGAGIFEAREPFHAASAVAAVRRETPSDLPVLAKLRPDVSRVVEAARAVVEAGATAVVVGNAVPAAMPDGRPAGLSGPAIAPIALRCVSEVCGRLPDVTVIGCGGVAEAAGARALLGAGAVAVQVGTALLRDPTTATRLVADLQEDQ
ncbi:tRNA-dihydrouridine synthase [Nocardioides sp. LHG3406-4]|uniref:tRNA-dihydrouridine synthase n=1 Tax=Nocardioides sp. LHG3406-4 TaxID=2804575 RepID=UPI003CF4C2F5